jgi:hypothetical protein
LSFLIVCRGFQFVNGSYVGVGEAKLLVELCFEVIPVQELGVTFVFFFLFKTPSSPFGGSSGFHIGECPDDFGLVIGQGFQAQDYVSLA